MSDQKSEKLKVKSEKLGENNNSSLLTIHFSLPVGWKMTTLGEVADVIGGGTPKTDVPEYWNGKIPWLSVVDFNEDNRWVYKTEKTITDQGLENSSTRLLNTGDLIISASTALT